MKKWILSSILILLIALPLFSANLQKTYSTSDDIWKEADRLCRSQGVLGPEPVSPTTGAAILQAIERLDYKALSAKEKRIYDDIKKELTQDKNLHFTSKYVDMNLDIVINPEIYLFNHSKDTYYYEFFRGFNESPAPLEIKGEASFGDILYMYLGYSFRDAPFYWSFDSSSNTVHPGELFYRFTNFAFLAHPDMAGNWYFFNKWQKDHGYTMVNNYRPLNVGTSIGNEFLNFFIGKAPHSMGSGKLGNMTISDSLIFQDVAMFSVFTGIFSYNLSLTFFDNFEAMYPLNGGAKLTANNSLSLNGDHQIRTIHRFAFNILNKFRITLETGALLVTNSFDFRIFFPFVIPHNWGNNKENMFVSQGDEANNILTVSLDYTPIKNLTFNFQFTSDQMRVAGENGGGRPNAFGLLFNTTYTFDMKNLGYIDLWGEFYYSSPYLYLNTKYDIDWAEVEHDLNEDKRKEIMDLLKQDNWKEITEKYPQYVEKNYRYDWIVGYGYDRNSASEFAYSGYPFGPDTISGAIGFEWDSYKSWKAGANIIYKVHGGMGYQYVTYDSQNMDNTVGVNLDAITPTSTPEHTLQIEVEGEYRVNKHLSFFASISNSSIWNYHNERGAFKDYIQSAFNLKWNIF